MTIHYKLISDSETWHVNSVISPTEVTRNDLVNISEQPSVVQVNIGSGVTHVRDFSFFSMRLLSLVNMSDTVLSLEVGAFKLCTALTFATLSENLEAIGERAFYMCRSLKRILMPKSVLSIGAEAFSGCRSLEEVTIPRGIKNIPVCCFNDCRTLKQINMSDSVERVESGAFIDCRSLVSIALSNAIKKIPSLCFRSCESLRHIKWPVEIDRIDDQAFYGCSSLRYVVIPDSVKSMGIGALSHCAGLTFLVLSNALTFPTSNMLAGCDNLKVLVTPNSWNKDDAISLNLPSDTYVINHVEYSEARRNINMLLRRFARQESTVSAPSQFLTGGEHDEQETARLDSLPNFNGSSRITISQRWRSLPLLVKILVLRIVTKDMSLQKLNKESLLMICPPGNLNFVRKLLSFSENRDLNLMSYLTWSEEINTLTVSKYFQSFSMAAVSQWLFNLHPEDASSIRQDATEEALAVRI